ncbi:MAG TPA: hypothetical protein VMO00_09120 [Methylomirabilota bacterium]|nr:hypothetical protein [Methylomirabilota bacterium]
MKRKRFLRVLLFGFFCLDLAFGPAYSLTTDIKDILDHPRDFEGKEITLHGTVTNAVSLVLIKYYEIQDGTGSIKIVTDKLLPSRGEKLSVTGRTTVIELGTERWVVLRESQGQNTAPEQRDYLTDNANRSAY